MDDHPAADPIDRITTTAIFVAPVLLATSTIAYSMESGMNRSAIGGVLQFYALGVLTIAIVALVAPLRPILPRTAAVLLATGLLTGVFGASYGIDAIWAATTGLPQLVDQDLAAGLIAMGPGALVLPVTFVGLGIAYARTGLAPAAAGYLLALAGLTFPAGRATNLLPVAHATDVLLLVALVAIGRRLVARNRSTATSPLVTH